MLDVDGDGLITASDIRPFYDTMALHLSHLGHEAVPFADLLCQLTDAINPRMSLMGLASPPRGAIALADLRRSPTMTPLLVNALTNVSKFLAAECSDLHSVREAQAAPHLSEWDRFASAEYARLADDDDDVEDDMCSHDGDADNANVDFITADDDEGVGGRGLCADHGSYQRRCHVFRTSGLLSGVGVTLHGGSCEAPF